MGKREKLIERLTKGEQNATFTDIRNLLEYEGFYLDRVTDTHHIYIYAQTIFVVPIHQHSNLKTICVERILESIEQADTELEDDE